jgi:lysophospholipase L1-like esterase
MARPLMLLRLLLPLLLPPLAIATTAIQIRASVLDPSVQLLNGRFERNATAGTARADWTGATVAFTVTGTSSVALQIIGSSQWAVVVDGVETGVVQSAPPQSQPVTLATGLSLTGSHTVSAIKMLEALCGPATISGVVMDAGGKLLPPPPPPARRLAFLGDSITCGYGALGVAPCPGYSCGAPSNAPKNESNWESGYFSYSMVLGRRFKADTQTICVSGAGFAHQWNKPGVAPTHGGMTEKFGMVLGSGPDEGSNLVDPAAWVPDALVINIGTNDVGVPHSNTSSVWVQTYLTFLKHWRAVWPHTHFFLGCFPMLQGDGMTPAIQLVADALADTKTTVLSFPKLQTTYGKGCYGHPSVAGHAAMAEATGAVLGKALGWV